MRGDYKELIDLSIFYLEGKPEPSDSKVQDRSIKLDGWGNYYTVLN